MAGSTSRFPRSGRGTSRSDSPGRGSGMARASAVGGARAAGVGACTTGSADTPVGVNTGVVGAICVAGAGATIVLSPHGIAFLASFRSYLGTPGLVGLVHASPLFFEPFSLVFPG